MWVASRERERDGVGSTTGGDDTSLVESRDPWSHVWDLTVRRVV